jgi:UDP:flavonoid glycosyltransferase YjiC (YdhE family)
VRLLFGFVGGRGHLEPLAPVARAAVARGHAVAVAAHPGSAGWVAEHELEAIPLPGVAPGGPPERRPLTGPDQAREDRALREAFGGRLARERATGVLAIAREWRPDAVVCDEVDFGAMIGAERLSLPHATVLVSATGGFLRRELLAEPLDALRAEHGLPPDPALAMLRRDLVLSPFPPSLRDGHAFRAGSAALAHGEALYVTLGTVVNLESGDLFTRLLAGVRNLGRDVIVTIGAGIDPVELGPQPPHVDVERHIPQDAVLPHCAAVVFHGGSGTLLGALAHGLPSVLLPLGADQPTNARRCVELGAGVELDAVRATPDEIAAAVETVLSDPAYRRAAERVHSEIAALPGPERAVELIEAL